MPFQVPISGLSLILHLVINLASFVFRKTKKILNRFDIKIHGGYLSPLANNPKYSSVRSSFAYFVVLFMLFGITNIGLYISASAGFLPYLFAREGAIAKNVSETSNLATGLFEIISSGENTEEILVGNLSVVDSLLVFGVSNPTLDFRAKLAEKIEVVEDESEYQGTEKQNLNILRKLRKDQGSVEEILAELIRDNNVKF
jgi:hypothetical protein